MLNRVRELLLKEFKRRGLRAPEEDFLDFMVLALADDPQCVRELKRCVEVAVDAYRDHLEEREVVKLEMRELLGARRKK